MLESELEHGIAATVAVAAALVDVHGITILYMTVAPFAVEKITYMKSILRRPA